MNTSWYSKFPSMMLLVLLCLSVETDVVIAIVLVTSLAGSSLILLAQFVSIAGCLFSSALHVLGELVFLLHYFN